MYQVNIERKAMKRLATIPDPYYSNIKNTLIQLAIDPRPQGFKKLKNRDAYRVRVSNYRIIYEIHDSVLQVLIIAIGHRKNIY